MTEKKKKQRSALARLFAFILAAVALTVTANGCARIDARLHGDGDMLTMSYSASMLNISIDSPQGFVYDVSNDTIIYSKGQNKVIYPGSTTKLLTALYALSVLPLDKEITPGNELELVKPGSSIAYIKTHHRLTVEMLVQGMMIPSGNDAAYVLAAAVGRTLAGDENLDGGEAVEIFMNGMRGYASDIGLCGSSFTVPDGYGNESHYTTTEDMIIVSRLAMENEIIAKYAAMPAASVVYASGHTNEWINTNKLLDKESEFYNEYVTGLKTGSIDGECSLIFSFRFDDGREYIAGVFGADDKNTRFYDAERMIGSLR